MCLLFADVDGFGEWSVGGAWALLMVEQPLMVKPITRRTSPPLLLVFYCLLTQALCTVYTSWD